MGLDQVRAIDPETLRLAFLWRAKRKVRRDATLSLQSNRYQVDPSLAGRTVILHFDPFDLSRLELYLDDQHLGSATVVIQKRQRHLAVERLATCKRPSAMSDITSASLALLPAPSSAMMPSRVSSSTPKACLVALTRSALRFDGRFDRSEISD